MIIDLFIVILLVAAGLSGSRSGFLRRFWAGTGFVTGLLLGRFVSPHLVGFVSTSEQKALVALTILLALGILGLFLGEYFGSFLKSKLIPSRLATVNKLDNAFGSVLSVLIILGSVWLLAAVLNSLPYRDLRKLPQGSYIIRGLNQLLPPAPPIISNIGYLIDPNSFPDVFLGNEPIPSGDINLPELGTLAEIVNQNKASVVRIKGQGCGAIVAGSGFIIAPGMVATNAHVVAGVDQPFIQDTSGSHKSRVVWFNSRLDFAVLRTEDPGALTAAPLGVRAETVKAGTSGAALGYPGGGDFTATPAAVLSDVLAKGRDIYGKTETKRHIYELRATITSGDSGGPVIDQEGKVIGMIFAESTTYKGIGYALTGQEIADQMRFAQAKVQAIPAGDCAQ